MLIPVSLATDPILAATFTSFLAPTLRVQSGVRSRVKYYSDLGEKIGRHACADIRLGRQREGHPYGKTLSAEKRFLSMAMVWSVLLTRQES